MPTTKQRILESAMHLFNQYGVANVRLQQIADETGISVGNLAYHFKNKEAIVTGVYDVLFEAFSEILSSYLQAPNLADLDAQLSQYYQFFAQHRFYLTDLFEMERHYPQVFEKWRGLVSRMLLQIGRRLDYYVKRGVLKPEPSPGIYDALANNLWMIITFWIPQQMLKGGSIDEQVFKDAIWMQLNPYLTARGHDELAAISTPSNML